MPTHWVSRQTAICIASQFPQRYAEDTIHRWAFAQTRVYAVQSPNKNERGHGVCVNKPQLNIQEGTNVRIFRKKSLSAGLGTAGERAE